jgi:hypothetical protein
VSSVTAWPFVGARGLQIPDVPNLSVWGYAESTGLMQELKATSGD